MYIVLEAVALLESVITVHYLWSFEHCQYRAIQIAMDLWNNLIF